MSRFFPYLGIGAGILVALFFTDIARHMPPPSGQNASVASSSQASSSLSFAPLSLPSLAQPATTIASSSVSSSTAAQTKSSKQTVPPRTRTGVKTASSTPPDAVAPQPSGTTSSEAEASSSVTDTVSANDSLGDAAETLRSALVNILCYAPSGSGLHSISGSGIIITPTGLILTNAHVAQYFLLADQSVQCVIRTGSPAADRYTAALVFISPAWLRANPSVLRASSPSGTGEHDFALLAITHSVTSAPAPNAFPFIPLARTAPQSGASVVLASYGAQFLDTAHIESSLSPTVVNGSIKDIFTFGRNTPDVLALGGSAAAQEGSSGGGVASLGDTLVGTITTSTVEGSTDTRSLDAITASYIRADYATETGKPLDFLLTESTSTAVKDFAPQEPALESLISDP